MSDELAIPHDVDEFLALMDASWLRLMGFVESLNPAQLIEPTDAAGWSVKDHLAHLASWEGGMVALLQKHPRHEGMGVPAELYLGFDIEALNAGIQERRKGQSLEDVLDDLEATHRALVEQVQATPPGDLLRSYSWYQPDEPGEDDGSPVLNRIAGNTYAHYDEHIPWMAAIVGMDA